MNSQARHDPSSISIESSRPNLILSVDDEPSVLWSRQLLLQSAGYEVVSAADGEQALVYFQASRADIVILDYKMPGMNGAEVAREMKLRQPSVPIIMVSAMPLDEAMLVSVECLITKGGGPERLLEKIKELLAVGRVLRADRSVTDGHSSVAEKTGTG